MLLIRLRTQEGLERVQVPDDGASNGGGAATVGDLRAQIEAQLGIPAAEQVLSLRQELLLQSADLAHFAAADTLADPAARLNAVGVQHGSIVYCRHTVQDREVAPVTQVNTTAFRPSMTVEQLLAKQIRIEREEKGACASCSLDFAAANAFQQYVNQLAFKSKRGGFMYGRADEDGKVEVEFIYEPPQEGAAEELALLLESDAAAEEQRRVDFLAAALGLQCVGWIFSQTAEGREFCLEKDITVTTAEFHEMLRQQRRAGGDDRFVSVVVFIDEAEDGEEGATEIQFEAFQCSKQSVQLWEAGVFDEEAKDATVSHTTKPIVVAGKDVTEVDNDFFLVPVSILNHNSDRLKCSFPVENRIIPQGVAELREHLEAHRHRKYVEKLSDFHVLLYLSKQFQLETDMALLAGAVAAQSEVRDGYQALIDAMAGI
mmetsp:Transcript_2195/g.7858  ORF Transcript_2195/g.7858 Transcript_2195/m.7858 type:complete len:430 (-) Transcript_2195:167-1456(-)